MLTEKLNKFHRDCKDEYNELIKEFNILFYGYGCKESILKEIFPGSLFFNCNIYSLNNILDELIVNLLITDNSIKSFKELDQYLVSQNTTIIIVLLNFDFKMESLIGLKAVKIVGTLENVFFQFTQEDILRFNFIYRDLTTYSIYSDDIIGINFNDTKLNNAMMVYNSVSGKSQVVFKALLVNNIETLANIFQLLKKELMITRKSKIKDLLNEFIENKIIKINGEKITVLLNKSERDKIVVRLN